MKKRNDFDAIASFYDALAGIIFGASIKKAQLHFIPSIPENSKILFIGGGTGWLLPTILKIPGVSITYVDLSVNMIKQARKKILPEQEKSVKFIQKDIYQFLNGKKETVNEEFNVIITNFFLDVFNKENLVKIMILIDRVLQINGLWICTDFQKQPGRSLWYSWQNFLIYLMYKFFKMISNIEGKRILDFDAHFASLKFIPVHEVYFFHTMIKTSLFKKSECFK
ncbi:hypothetical protein BH23BAC1_BH23BAC1_01880 [soil metagenome]